MAIRIDASGDYLRRTANLPNSNSFTMACWCYLVADRNAWSYVVAIENSTTNASAYYNIGWRSDTTFELSTHSGSIVLTDTVPGTWNFLALSRQPAGNIFVYHRTLAGVWQTGNRACLDFTPAVVWFGSDSYNEWVNCRLAAMKVWNVGLTAAEIEREAQTILPKRLNDLNFFAPGFPGASERLRDYSGNGYTLTAGGTLTDEDPPPISWGAPYIMTTPVTSTPPPAASLVPKNIARRMGHMLIR